MRYNIHPITAVVHYKLATMAFAVNAESALDMGGEGGLSQFVGFPVVDANIKRGIDGCNLPYEANQFDVAVSVATLEHVHDQAAFLKEAARVSRKGAFHWCCFGPRAAEVERFKHRFGDYRHPCRVPLPGEYDDVVCDVQPFLTVAEHLLLLATMYPSMNCKETHAYVTEHGPEPYGAVLVSRP